MLPINTDLCKNISCTASSKPNPLLVSYKLFKILSPQNAEGPTHTVSCESNSVCSQQGDKPSWWGLGFFLFKAGLLIKEDLASVPAVTSQHRELQLSCALDPQHSFCRYKKGRDHLRFHPTCRKTVPAQLCRLGLWPHTRPGGIFALNRPGRCSVHVHGSGQTLLPWEAV